MSVRRAAPGPTRSFAAIVFINATLVAVTCAMAIAAPASAQSTDAAKINRAAAVGVWEGVIGTRSRGATLLSVRLTLRTGLEVAEESEPIEVAVDPEEQAAIDEARARAAAIRAGRDPEATAAQVAGDERRRDAAARRAAELESARLRRERGRADRLEGTLEFKPFYGDGAIRRGLGGVPEIDDATGQAAVVGFLDPHTGALTLRLTRWIERPDEDLLRTNELHLVLDPAEPVLFGETASGGTATAPFTPVLAWPEGRAPEAAMARLRAVTYPNTFSGERTPAGAGRLERLAAAINTYDARLASLERTRPGDTIDRDFAANYQRVDERLEQELATNQRNHDRSIEQIEKQLADLDEREAAGGLKDSDRRRIASRRESLAERRVQAKEQLDSRDQRSRERHQRERAKLDERVAEERAEIAEEIAEWSAERAALEASRPATDETVAIDTDVIRSWIDRIAAEYPEVMVDGAPDFTHPVSAVAVLNALRDDVFVEAFGAPYASLTEFDMMRIGDFFIGRNNGDSIRNGSEGRGSAGRGDAEDAGADETAQPDPAQPRRRGRGAGRDRGRATAPPDRSRAAQDAERERVRALNDERRELLARSRFALEVPFEREYERNLVRLAVLERTNTWLDGLRADLADFEPDARTFVRLDAIERAIALRTVHLRPSEQDAALVLAVQARREHADATALALSSRKLETAKGQRGIATLSYFWASQPALDRLVSNETRRTVDASIDAGLDRLIGAAAAALQERIRALDATEDPVEALRLGAAIYRDFLGTIGAARRRAIAREVLAAIAARRPADLARVQADIGARIDRAASIEEARRIAASVLILPSDAETPSGQRIAASVARRGVELEREAWLALFSERERAMLDEATGRLDVPAAYGAPTAEEVRLALLRAFAREGGGEVLDPFTCVHVVPGLGKLDIKVRMELRDVRIVSIAPQAGGGYRVSFTFRRSMTPEGNLSLLVNDESWQGSLVLDMLDAFGDNVIEASVEGFELTPAGWRSPTLAARLDLASAMQPLRVMTGDRRIR